MTMQNLKCALRSLAAIALNPEIGGEIPDINKRDIVTYGLRH